MRDPQSSEPTVIDHCDVQTESVNDDGYSHDWSRAHHVAFWPASAALLLLLGAGGAWAAARRLRVPAGPLPRGIRLA